MEDKEIDFLVGEYLRFWGELGIDDISSRETALRTRARTLKCAESRSDEPSESPPAAPATGTDLDSLRKQFGFSCGNPSCARPHKVVFGAGNPHAKLVFVGDLPGAEEMASGLPFVGKDGQLLTKIIEAMGTTRDQVYLTYALRCEESEAELARGAELLRAQLAAIRPRCLVALGPIAAAMLTASPQPPRGQWLACVWDPRIGVMPSFSPAHLLQAPGDKKTAWEDMKKVKARLEGANA